MIEILEQPEGIVVRVRAQPGSRRNEIIGIHAGALKVAVTAAPEKGKANAAVLEVLTRLLGLKRSQAVLLSGATSRDKKVMLTGISRDWATRCLKELGVITE